MRNALVTVFVLALGLSLCPSLVAQGGPTGGQGFHEDCNGTCSTLGSVGAECFENNVHPQHEANNSTGNCGPHPDIPGELICANNSNGEATYLNGTIYRWSCASVGTYNVCSISGNFKCGQVKHPIEYGCANNRGSSVLSASRDEFACVGGNGGGIVLCGCNGDQLSCFTGQ